MNFSLLLAVLLCGVPLAVCGGETVPAPEQAERLRRLLARVDGEPLAVFSVLDARATLDRLARTAAGRAFADPQYAPQRREAYRLLEEVLGAHPEALWDALRPHVAGPMALVWTGDGAGRKPEVRDGGAADGPALRCRLFVAVRDRGSIEAVQLGWPQIPPDSDALLGGLSLELCPLEQLASNPPAPEWADRCARMIGEMQWVLRPGASRTLLAPEEARTPAWVKALKALGLLDVERIEWNVLPLERYFVEELRCELKPEARSLLARLLLSLRPDPQSWEALERALPGGHEVQLLLQTDLKAMGDGFPVLMRFFERMLRGKRWTGLHGDSEDALAPDRFGFLTRPWAGTFGLLGKSGESGETQLIGVAAEPGTKSGERRRQLLEGLAGIGLDFETSARAPTIGGQPPLAAGFKGRGIMPAPMIGLSDGWIWLCSSTAAYHELVAALAEQRHLGKDRRAAFVPDPVDRPGIPFPEKSVFELRVNLPGVGPLAYTSWMLGEGGPQLFGWKVPSGLLPSPGFLKKHLVPYVVAGVRTGFEVRFHARGPAPGGALVPFAVLAALSEEMRRMEASGPEALRRELEALTGQGPETGRGDDR
mgnify:CR=1 FL=1